MKLTKLSLIILTIIIGVAALILTTNYKSTNQTKTIVASPTLIKKSSTPATIKYSPELKAKVRSEFIGNCETKGHYSITECNCAADYLAKNYSESELAKIYIQYRTSSEVPSALEDASKICLNK